MYLNLPKTDYGKCKRRYEANKQQWIFRKCQSFETEMEIFRINGTYFLMKETVKKDIGNSFYNSSVARRGRVLNHAHCVGKG